MKCGNGSADNAHQLSEILSYELPRSDDRVMLVVGSNVLLSLTACISVHSIIKGKDCHK